MESYYAAIGISSALSASHLRSAAYWQARPPQPLASYRSSCGWDWISNPGMSAYVAARFPLGAGKIWLWQVPMALVLAQPHNHRVIRGSQRRGAWMGRTTGLSLVIHGFNRVGLRHPPLHSDMPNSRRACVAWSPAGDVHCGSARGRPTTNRGPLLNLPT